MCTKLYFKYNYISKYYIILYVYSNKRITIIYVSIPKNKELIHVSIPFEKIKELIPPFVPLKRNQFQESFLNNTVHYTRVAPSTLEIIVITV